MPLQLTPSIYGQQFKWGVLPKNKIDTILAKPMLNNTLDEPTSYEAETTQVIAKGQTLNLPISPGIFWDTCAYSTNQFIGNITLARGYVSAVMAKGSIKFTLDKPTAITPQAILHVEGTTYSVEKGKLTFAEVDEQLRTDTSAVAQYIKDKHTDSSTWSDIGELDYTAPSIPLYPWAKKLVSSGTGTAWQRVFPAQEDILTDWSEYPAALAYGPFMSYWKDIKPSKAVYMLPPLRPGEEAATAALRSERAIVVNNETIPI